MTSTASPRSTSPNPGIGMSMRTHHARRRHASRLSTRFVPGLSDLLSIEASFILFLFAGRYKMFPELRGFPIDFTVLFFVLTAALIAWALVSGRMRPFPLNLPVLLMILFSEFAAASLFWSSLDPFNKDKLIRFLLFTSTSFFAAYMFGQDKERRERLLRMLALLSCAILLYYVYYRYVLGIDMAGPSAGKFPEDSNNYLEYNAHASILFIMFIALAVLGSSKQMWLAFAGAGAMLFLLATIGGRGPLAVALLAIPLMGVGLFLRPQGVLKGLTRLLMFVAILCVIAGATYTVMVQAYGSETWEHLRTLDRYDMQLSSEDTTSLDERRDARELAIQGWHEKPILGWGIGEFRVQSVFGYPHNLLLEILMELGLVGAFFFLPICVIAVVACVRVVQRRTCGWTEITIALLYVTELVSHLTVQGYLADNRSFFAYLGLALGMGIGQVRRAPPESKPQPTAALVHE